MGPWEGPLREQFKPLDGPAPGKMSPSCGYYRALVNRERRNHVKLRFAVRASLCVLAASAVAVPAALAAKTGNGSSTGTGTVFLPNPVAELQNQSLTDQKDADYAALQPAYHNRTLTNLDGSGFLQGDWANVRSETGDPAYSPTNTFLYHRHDDR